VNPRRFRLDASARRPDGGRVLIAGSPLRVFTLGAGGVRVVEAIERGDTPPAGHEPLTDRLLDAGAIHPVVDLAPVDAALLTVVVPTLDTTPHHRPGRCRTVVVDDASAVPVQVQGAHVVRLPRNVGPGAARNMGLAEVTTPYVAFVDSDVDISEDDLLAVAAHLDDPRAALVAPRVLGHPNGTGVLARYEQMRSPLDLGPAPARVAPTTRVAYVPAAALVCRTEAVRAVGGFDTALRYGEDVDLVWRLHEAGWRCRYEPAVQARHDTRRTLGAWLAQRYRYGTSAAPLAARHPGALAPVRMSGWSAAAWIPTLCGLPVVGALVAAGTTVALVRKLRTVPARECVRLAGLGHLYAGRLLAGALTRAWWPLAVVAALCSRRARRTLLVAAAITVATSWRDDRPADRPDDGGAPLDPVRYTALRLADDAAYGAGVWAGSLAARRLDALLPSFEAWPPR
jgi:mycofactocin system glycosyltransferase